MYVYAQKTGELKHDGVFVGKGYSGKGNGKNSPGQQSIKNVGPIPQGTYMIGAPVDTVTHGPHVLPLTPDPANEMFGRSGFLIHGDSVVHPGTASMGCIILGRSLREQISESGDFKLEVVAEFPFEGEVPPLIS